MKKITITTPLILGAITIAEIAIVREMNGSIVLWIMYGMYKLFDK